MTVTLSDLIGVSLWSTVDRQRRSLVDDRRAKKGVDSLVVRERKCCLVEAIAWLEARLSLVREMGNNNIIFNS